MEAKKSEGIQECFKEEWNVVSRGRNTPFLLQSIHTHTCMTGLLFLGPLKKKKKSISVACNTEIGHLKQCKQGFCKQKGDAVSEIADQE